MMSYLYHIKISSTNGVSMVWDYAFLQPIADGEVCWKPKAAILTVHSKGPVEEVFGRPHHHTDYRKSTTAVLVLFIGFA